MNELKKEDSHEREMVRDAQEYTSLVVATMYGDHAGHGRRVS